MLKPLEFESVNVGDELVSVKYQVTNESIREYADIVEDWNPWFVEDSPFEGPVAHPTYTAWDYQLLMSATFLPRTSQVHAKTEHEYIRPIKPGTVVTVTGKIVDKYVRRGREYVVVASEARDEEGNLLVRSKDTRCIDITKPRQE